MNGSSLNLMMANSRTATLTAARVSSPAVLCCSQSTNDDIGLCSKRGWVREREVSGTI